MALVSFKYVDQTVDTFDMLHDLWVTKVNHKFPFIFVKMLRDKKLDLAIETENLLNPNEWNGEITLKLHNSLWSLGQSVVHPVICKCTPSSIKINYPYITFKWERP